MAHTTLENRFFYSCSWTGLITGALTQNDSEPKSIQFCGLVSSDEASWQTELLGKAEVNQRLLPRYSKNMREFLTCSILSECLMFCCAQVTRVINKGDIFVISLDRTRNVLC